jgi:hypothetical protein
VLYTITCQIAYMTPPFGYNLFLMRAMAPPEIALGDIYRSIMALRDDHAARPGADHDFPADRALAAQWYATDPDPAGPRKEVQPARSS